MEGGQRSWGHCGAWLLHIMKPSYPVQTLWRSNTPIHLNPSSSISGHHSPSPSVYSSVQRLSKGGGDLSHPACPAQRTVLRAAGAFYWNRGCMCYVMGTSSWKLDHWLARLINARTGKKARETGECFANEHGPTYSWSPALKMGSKLDRWYQSWQSWPMAHQQSHAGVQGRSQVEREPAVKLN